MITRECKLAANRLTEFPMELTNLPNLHLLDLSLNQVEGFILTLVTTMINVLFVSDQLPS